MELTPEQRKVIYLEEKAKRENEPESSSIELLIVFNIIAAIALYGVFSLGKNPHKTKLTLEAIRRAYSGLAPDEVK
ncbi:MAG: hypothetical protein JW871_03515 [Endomicrobiales bacterium]|nr:hypothetical protein [Endomicrobiales bacterium]